MFGGRRDNMLPMHQRYHTSLVYCDNAGYNPSDTRSLSLSLVFHGVVCAGILAPARGQGNMKLKTIAKVLGR